MCAFFLHPDAPDVHALRIRTPKFDTHEEAELSYYSKRQERDSERRCWRIVYVSIAAFTLIMSGYLWSIRQDPRWWLYVRQFIVGAGSSMVCAYIAFSFCKGLQSWCWEMVGVEDEKEDDAVTHSAV